ncbi:MAG: hypothetical protein PHS04_16550 [Tissierellia bacterium]|nr:hypothetical protein [Tissierellia bacterium]
MNTLGRIAYIVGGNFTINTDGVKNVNVTYKGKDNKTIIKAFARCNLTEDKFKLKKGINICLERIMATTEMCELLNKQYKIIEYKTLSYLTDKLLELPAINEKNFYKFKDNKKTDEDCLNNINHDYF